jgi:hypothetical protein
MDIAGTIRQTRFRSGLLPLGFIVAVAGPLRSELGAQQVQFHPHAGVSLPTRISIKDGGLHVRQKIGVVAGARMTLTFSERFDVVTGFSYTPGYAIVSGAGKRIEAGTSPHQLNGSTGARYWLILPGRSFSWQIHTNLGVVFGGAPAYGELFESSTVSATLGTILHYQIGQIVSLHLRVQERLYRARFGVTHPGKFSRPLQVSLGVGLPFLESARILPHSY